jgi:hypothetical protein
MIFTRQQKSFADGMRAKVEKGVALTLFDGTAERGKNLTTLKLLHKNSLLLLGLLKLN